MAKSIAQRIRDAKVKPEFVTLRDAGIIDAEGVITQNGRYVLRALLLDKFEKELVVLATEFLAEKDEDCD